MTKDEKAECLDGYGKVKLKKSTCLADPQKTDRRTIDLADHTQQRRLYGGRELSHYSVKCSPQLNVDFSHRISNRSLAWHSFVAGMIVLECVGKAWAILG